MRIQSIINTNDAIEIAYIEEADIDVDAGVMESRVVRIAHEALPQDHIEELTNVVVEMLDLARRKRHRVADEFKAPRR